MTAYVALLRAVNLMSSSRLPMAELRRVCEEAGFEQVRTFIASGNVVFSSAKKEAAVKADLESRLKAHSGKPVDVIVRTAREMAAIVEDFPFKDTPKSRTAVIFLDGKPPADALDHVSGQADEEVALGKREIYVAYGENGIGRSKLKIPAAAKGTARNINTVAKLAEMAGETSGVRR
jgi:uncharacterized protein (DUF1697 family)